MNRRALIAMSGGVDSSVAALLMRDAGFECTGAASAAFTGERLSSGRCSKMERAPAGQTARQCSHFQQPFQPNSSNSAICTFPSPSRERMPPGQTRVHSPQPIHVFLST